MNLPSLRGRGLKNRLLHPYDAFWDRRLGVRTFGFIPAIGAAHDANWQGHYEPTPYRDIFAVLRHARVGPGDVFVDLGCGLGRTVFVANRLGAARSIGVEINTRFAAQCLESAGNRRFAGGAVDFVCTPAQTYSHRDTTTVYMFHPFGAGTMREVVEGIDAELDSRPRRFKVIYFNPVFDDVLGASRHLKLKERWPPHSRMLTRSGHYGVSFWAV